MQDKYVCAENTDHCVLVKERLVTLIKPIVKEGCVELEEVRIFYEPGWKVQVSEEVHVTSASKGEQVYLIDFIPEQSSEEFRIEIVADDH